MLPAVEIVGATRGSTTDCQATQALRVRPRPWMRAVSACTIGSFASFRLLQRCAALFG